MNSWREGVLCRHVQNKRMGVIAVIDLVRWDPFNNLEELHDRVNRLFQESMGRTTGRREPSMAARGWSPLVDIYEDTEGLAFRVDLAGVGRDDIEIEVAGDTLVISGERKPLEQEGRDYWRVERPYGPFRRTFNIGMPIRQSEIRASLKEGVLEIRIPKAEETKPKKIEVEME
jgi:HSP20 family protein